MRSFEYESPADVADVVQLLEPDGASAKIRPLAGGTDLLTLMKADIVAPERLIDIKRLPGLSADISLNADGLSLGALTPLSKIEKSELTRGPYQALADAVAQAATPQLRNRATIGGNLLQRPRCWYFRNSLVQCWLKGGDECQAKHGENQLHALFGSDQCVATHPSDAASALLALDAEVRLTGGKGERVLPLSEFFALPTDDRRTETVIAGDEILLEIRIPTPAPGTRSVYHKAMERKVWAFALVGVAAVVRLGDNNRIEEARLVLTGVAQIPWRVPAAERVLIGGEASEDLFARAADAALNDAHPLAHNGYKVPLAKSMIVQALRSVTGNTSA